MKNWKRRGRLAILVAAIGLLLGTVGCEGTAYYGVSVGGPYGYGPYGGGYYGRGGYYGGVVVGHPF